MNSATAVPVICAVITAAAAIWAAYIARKIRTDDTDRRNEVLIQWRQIQDLQADVLTLKRFAFTLRARLAGANVVAPEMPRLKSEEWES